MGLTDRLKDLTKKAEEAVVEHKGQIQQGVKKASAAADKRTGGKYHERIQKAEEKAGALVDKLPDAAPDPAAPAPDPPTAP